MKYDPEYTRAFYNEYGDREWGRLERSAYGRLQYAIHEGFIRRYIKPGMRVLDAGSGPGRFSIFAAKNAAKVTVLDISDTQLEISRQKIIDAGVRGFIERFLRADITDLSVFTDNTFDLTICFGGALSYVCENRNTAAAELVRVTKPEGIILASAMSHMGTSISPVTLMEMEMLENPDKDVAGTPALWPLVETGDLPPFPSAHLDTNHAPMHLYRAEELEQLFPSCTVLETAGSNVTLHEGFKNGETIAESRSAWDTLVQLEKRLNHDPGLVNSGSHIIVAVRKNRD